MTVRELIKKRVEEKMFTQKKADELLAKLSRITLSQKERDEQNRQLRGNASKM